jgi:hypothetical protein
MGFTQTRLLSGNTPCWTCLEGSMVVVITCCVFHGVTDFDECWILYSQQLLVPFWEICGHTSCFQLFLILSLNLQFHYGSCEFIVWELNDTFHGWTVPDLIFLPFSEDQIEALPAAAHMLYAKQSFYKQLIHCISKTTYMPKNRHHCGPKNCCVVLGNIALRTI